MIKRKNSDSSEQGNEKQNVSAAPEEIIMSDLESEKEETPDPAVKKINFDIDSYNKNLEEYLEDEKEKRKSSDTKIDIVIISGDPSPWNFNEINFSLRTIFKHVIDQDKIGNAVIVGKLPPFLKDVIHIPAKDQYKNSKARNIMEKMLAACNDDRVSENFLCVNDDHFLNAPASIENFPFYSHGTLQEFITPRYQQSPYTKTAINTLNALDKPPLTNEPVFFNVHSPVLINKSKFIKAMSMYDWNIDQGYLIKTLYLNTIGAEKTETKDCVVRERVSLDGFLKLINEQPFFSTTDAHLHQDMKDWFGRTYKEKSKYEI